MRDEQGHYITCGICGQSFDMRDLAAVIAHEKPGHGPIDPASLPIVGGLGSLVNEKK